MSVVQVKERPILFSAPMVQAILEERKTQTRRIVKTPKKLIEFYRNGAGQWANSKTGEIHEIAYEATFTDGFGRFLVAGDMGYENIPCPYGKVGDRLWVKESFYKGVEKIWYKSDIEDLSKCGIESWKSPLFMPRWASRITLEITDIQVERVKGISEEDAIAEGVPPFNWDDGFSLRPIPAFEKLWNSINGKKQSWDSNPYVWVISFKKAGEQNAAN